MPEQERPQQEPDSRERSGGRKVLRLALVAVLVLLLAGSALLGWLLLAPAASGPERQATIGVSPGMKLPQIAAELQRQQVLDSPFRLKLAARLFGLAEGIQQGQFQLSSRQTPRQMLETLQVYSVPVLRIRLPEAVRAPQVAGLLQQELGLDSLRFLALVSDADLIDSLDLGLPDLEGLLHPDTYLVSTDEDERELLLRFVGHGLEVLRGLPGGDSLRGDELRRILTLASSIIQGEYQLAAEADTIAAVYVNRLQRGMKLQADPTVQILLPDGPRRLLLRDLEIDSPYNTYRYAGLPPGPIGNPDRVALQSALNPAKCEYLYFVARGDGSHAFSRTYEEHLENRKPLDRLRRQLGRQGGR